jgi:PAS domain S-box-containing protein
MEKRSRTFSAKAFVVVFLCLLATASAWSFFEYRQAKAKMAAEADSWARFLRSLKQTNTGLMEVKNGSTKIFYASPEAHWVFGYDDDDMNGMPIDAIMPMTMVYDHAKKMLESMERAKKHIHMGPKVVPVECFGRHRDGHEVKIVLRIIIGNESVFVMVNNWDETKFLPLGRPPNIPNGVHK